VSSSRFIRLRRPPVLVASDEPFVPTSYALDDIDQRWDALCLLNPAYYDGRLWHVVGVHRNGHGGATLHVQPCSYRFFAVQHGSLDLGCRPLGVKGMTWCDGRVLMGLRSRRVAGYVGCWEFAPGGSLDLGIDPAMMTQQELAEETGLETSRPPVPLAIFYDEGVRTWEIAYRLDVEKPTGAAPSPEYEELRWVAPALLPQPLSGIAATMRKLIPA
jgi:hypothetical protein